MFRYTLCVAHVLAIIFLFLMIIVAYTVGRFNGIIVGMNEMLEDDNKTMCMFLAEHDRNITIDSDGQCIIKGDRYQRMECFWGNVTTPVEDTRSILRKAADRTRTFYSFPLLGCSVR